MTRSIARGFLFLFAALPLLAHQVAPIRLEMEAGQTRTFEVSDASGCAAELRATSLNPAVATVTPPGPLTAASQTFTVQGVAAGSTKITVTWSVYDYYCNDAGSATVDVIVTSSASPNVIVTSLPRGLAQETNLAGGLEEFSIANIGTGPTTVTLARTGFTGYELTPQSATLAAGARQVFTIRGSAQPQGFYEGTIVLEGAGVPAGTTIPVRLVSANRPSSPPRPRPLSNRVDVGGAEGEPQRVTVTFTNDGTGTVRGVFSSDVPWIVPPTGVFQFNGNSSASAEVQIDLARRPPDTAATGNLSLQYLLSPLGKT
ncbi:MAG TPA: Ig-like domain-containing protein, partial [Thermoanaerobaculia bacterium]|nr:Ig-like domain-containing protein [Thermoanaerobaculia bacterium]